MHTHYRWATLETLAIISRPSSFFSLWRYDYYLGDIDGGRRTFTFPFSSSSSFDIKRFSTSLWIRYFYIYGCLIYSYIQSLDTAVHIDPESVVHNKTRQHIWRCAVYLTTTGDVRLLFLVYGPKYGGQNYIIVDCWCSRGTAMIWPRAQDQSYL